MSCLTIERKTHYLCQLDYIKLVMAFLVVACHTHPLYPLDEGSLIFQFCRALADIGVPFFFLSSGYMLFSACRDMDDQVQRQYIKTYICRILRQYCLWSLIYLPISVFGYLSNGASLFGMAVAFMRNLLLVGQNFCSWQLWYLLSALWGSIFLLLLYRYIKKDLVALILAVVAFAVAQIIDGILSVTVAAGSVIALLQKAIGVTIGQGRIFLGFAYLSVGKVLASRSHYPKIYLSLPLTVVLYVAAVLMNSPWLHLLMHVMFFTAALVLPLGVHKEPARFARKISTCVYYIHMLIIFGSYCLYGFAFQYGLWLFLVTCALSGALGVLLCAWGKKHPKAFGLIFA